jgi:hypothetical protein
MSRRAAAAALVLCACARAWATDVPANGFDDVSANLSIDAHALIDVYSAANFNRPFTATNQLRAFDFVANQPSLGYLRLTLARRPRRFGFRLDVGTGDTSTALFRSDPAAPTQPELARAQSHVEQAFATVVVPLGKGIRVDAGKFDTPVGYEGNVSLACWNYSRSLVYSFAEPSVNTGVRVSYRPLSQLDVTLYWLNGWNSTLTEGNDMRSFATVTVWHATPGLDLTLVYMAGLERPPMHLEDPRLSFRNLLDFYLQWNPTPQLAVTFTVDYGTDQASGGVQWWGATGYLHYTPLPWLAATLRGDYLADPQGFVTGHAQSVADVTTTLELSTQQERARLCVRLEYRHDQSNAFVFTGALPNQHAGQDTLTLALLAGL